MTSDPLLWIPPLDLESLRWDPVVDWKPIDFGPPKSPRDRVAENVIRALLKHPGDRTLWDLARGVFDPKLSKRRRRKARVKLLLAMRIAADAARRPGVPRGSEA